MKTLLFKLIYVYFPQNHSNYGGGLDTEKTISLFIVLNVIWAITWIHSIVLVVKKKEWNRSLIDFETKPLAIVDIIMYVIWFFFLLALLSVYVKRLIF